MKFIETAGLMINLTFISLIINKIVSVLDKFSIACGKVFAQGITAETLGGYVAKGMLELLTILFWIFIIKDILPTTKEIIKRV